jgi:predicted phosphodiesterase
MERDEMGRIIVDGKGTEKSIFKKIWPSFPDKKKSNVDPKEIEDAVRAVRKVKESAEVGQKEATWIPQMNYEKKNMLFLFLTDVHYASIRSDHDKLDHFMNTVKKTPNMFLVTGGDDVDNFNVKLGPVSTGVYEDPVEPGIQGRAWAKKIKELDRNGKVGFMVFGNHTDWNYHMGQDWYDTFLGGMEAPLLTSGGLVRVMFRGGARYEIAATHRYWGTSKLNPTNACKRFLEHEYPSADIALLGHTHQSEVLQFERGGKDRIAMIGGTLKSSDDYARKHGISGRSGMPGMCISLNPNKKEMQAYRYFDRAVEDHLRSL